MGGRINKMVGRRKSIKTRGNEAGTWEEGQIKWGEEGRV
jgi:hypothetical protein